jgi:hypothetical protein
MWPTDGVRERQTSRYLQGGVRSLGHRVQKLHVLQPQRPRLVPVGLAFSFAITVWSLQPSRVESKDVRQESKRKWHMSSFRIRPTSVVHVVQQLICRAAILL